MEGEGGGGETNKRRRRARDREVGGKRKGCSAFIS